MMRRLLVFTAASGDGGMASRGFLRKGDQPSSMTEGRSARSKVQQVQRTFALGRIYCQLLSCPHIQFLPERPHRTQEQRLNVVREGYSPTPSFFPYLCMFIWERALIGKDDWVGRPSWEDMVVELKLCLRCKNTLACDMKHYIHGAIKKDM